MSINWIGKNYVDKYLPSCLCWEMLAHHPPPKTTPSPATTPSLAHASLNVDLIVRCGWGCGLFIIADFLLECSHVYVCMLDDTMATTTTTTTSTIVSMNIWKISTATWVYVLFFLFAQFECRLIFLFTNYTAHLVFKIYSEPVRAGFPLAMNCNKNRIKASSEHESEYISLVGIIIPISAVFIVPGTVEF